MNHLSFSASPRPTQSSRFQLHPFALMGAIVGLSASTLSAQTLSAGANAAPVPSAAKSAALAAEYGKLPLSFEANHGQTDSHVRFLSRGNGYALFLTDKAAVLELTKSEPSKADKTKSAARANKTDVIRMELAGASQSAQVTGAEQLPGTANYFVGNDSSKWHTNVPTYAKVKYAGVYPGVDLVYYGNQSQLEYDFVVAPKADPKTVQLHFAGAEKLKLSANGDLIVAAKDGEIAFHKPVVYQAVNGQRQPVDGSFTLLARNTVGFTLGSYDRSRELVIDPTLAYSTYLGGSSPSENLGGNAAYDIAVDSAGSAYVTGSTGNASFPVTSGALQTEARGIFIAKFNGAGTALEYSTYLGGTKGGDTAYGIAVDASGNAYLTGRACTTDFPVTSGAFQNHNRTTLGCDAFVTKLNPDGSALVYSSYLGGSAGSGNNAADSASSIAVDASGNAYVAGTTYSKDFPVTSGAFDTAFKANVGGSMAFVSKVNPQGSALVYSTYLGGSNGAIGYGVAVDAPGNAYVTGSTSSVDFPVTDGAFQTVLPLNGDEYAAAFVTKLNPAGSGLVYSTFLSVNATTGYSDTGYSIAVDASGDAYVAGLANAIPVTSGAFRTTHDSYVPDSFVAKLNAQGSALFYSTYLGESKNNGGFTPQRVVAIGVDAAGEAYVAGTTLAANFPVTSDAYQNVSKDPGGTNSNPGQFLDIEAGNGYFLKLNSNGSALLYSTYLGGSGTVQSGTNYGDGLWGVTVDATGSAYVAGETKSANFPVTSGAFQTSWAGNSSGASNATLAKFSFGTSALIGTTTTLVASADPVVVGTPVTFTADVTPVAGSGTPTGTVQFSIDGATAVSEPVDGTGRAMLVSGSLAIGSHTVSASYSGDATYKLSTAGLTEVIESPVSAPVFSLAAGTYTSTQAVTITGATTGAAIYFTTDGSTPTASSTRYTSPISISTPVTLKAVAIAAGDPPSAVTTAAYEIDANQINFGQGFTSVSSLYLNGGAGVGLSGTSLELTDGGKSEYTSAVYRQPINVQSFTTDFKFQLTNAVANGFALNIFSADKNPCCAVSAYQGVGADVAIEFNLHANGKAVDLVGLYTDGALALPEIDMTSSGVNLHGGHPLQAHITYDGTNLVFALTDTVTLAEFTHSFAINLPETVGGNTAYVGFTASTGGSSAIQQILTWTFVPGPPNLGGTPNFPQGFGASGLVKNGSATISGTALALTNGGQFETASAFYPTPVNMQSFTTNFEFQLSGCCVDTPPYLADGITFTIQNVATTALGAKGGGLGYTGIGKSLAIKFDLHSDAGEGDNSTGLYIDGAAPTVPALNLNGNNSGINLQNGHIFDANLAYDGTNLVLTITDTVTKRAYTHSFAIDIPATVGGNTAYVGFTGATGALTATQEILNWTFTNP